MVFAKTNKNTLVFIGFRYLRWFSIGKPLQTNKKNNANQCETNNSNWFPKVLGNSLWFENGKGL